MPHGPDEFQGPAHEWGHVHVAVRLAAGPIDGGETAVPGVVDTGRGDQPRRRLLHASGLVIDPHVHRLAPQPRVDRAPDVVEPDWPLRPPLARLLAEAEDPPETRGFDRPASGVAQDDLG